MAVRSLLEELRRMYPEKKFVISTVTSTGNKIAQGLTKAGDFLTYLPLDFSFITRSVIDKIKPSLFIIAETEIWPNLITNLNRKKFPIIIVNGRISDHAFCGYKKIKAFLKPILNKISIFCVQGNRDAERFEALGVRKEKIKVTGNMKFDSASFKLDTTDLIKYRQDLNLNPSDQLLVCGSTHSGEEEAVLAVYKELQIDFPNLKLLIAPRHPERSKDIARVVSRFGFRPIFVSALPFECSTCMTKPVFILDLVGKLISFYALSDIVFVGGSLIKKGGHNILEPASLGKPVIFGPYMFNFRDIADLFLTNKAAVLINNQEELNSKIRELLNNPTDAAGLSQRAKELISKNSGSTKRNLDLITGIYSLP